MNNADSFPQKELDKFRKNIEYKREEQIKDLDIAKDLLEEVTSRDSADDNSAYSLHMEQGTDAMEREKRYLEVQRGSDYLKRLEEAMVRINNGTYGMCRKCGLRLDSRRLLEVPIAQVCPTYKNTNKLCEPGKLYKEVLDQDEE
ncbi:MAG: TraR/DksA family transcriptional regulator [Armatimonadetes bacterium]|nr:TraR/DksA family transcriptional regulator [Armatimonadota bacterium]